jgi:hypothetical protein
MAFDVANIESYDDDDNSEQEFEDEHRIKKVKRNKKKGGSKHSDSDGDEEFNDEPIRSKAKRKNSGAGRTSLSSQVSSIDLELVESREKLVVDRENAVNTRQRNFAKWFIAISVLVLIGTIILLAVYFANPRKSDDTPAPMSGAVPSAVPTTVLANTTPTMQPSKSPTAEPTPVPPNIVAVATTFQAIIPNGKLELLTVEGLEENLIETFEILFPQLLIEIFESDDTIARARNLLRTLQQSDKDNIAIRGPITVDILEVGTCSQK